jgi:hypothetical protein
MEEIPYGLYHCVSRSGAAMKPVSFGPFPKMVDASTGVLTQPKGSIPRASNLLATKRGALKTVDGSAIVNAYNGVPTLGRGRAMCEFFFQPTGVAPYYLRLMKALDQPLGAPANLTATLAAGGSLSTGIKQYYVVTALDGVGGETVASNEVSATPSGGNLSVALAWNVVPNAVAYNIYRGTASGSETLLVGVGLPVTALAYTDTGAATLGVTLSVTSLIEQAIPANYVLTLAADFQVSGGGSGIYTAGSNSVLNGTYVVSYNISNSVLSLTGGTHSPVQSSTGGTFFFSQSPPLADTTQQTALYVMRPASYGILYNDELIAAFFPADVRFPDGFPGGGTFGGGGQQGSTPSGGIVGGVSLIPQIVQFTNQAVLALGNGFAPQVYSDHSGTPTNPAGETGITSISVDANGVVTIQTSGPHGLNLTQALGANIYLEGITNNAYNTNGNGASAFVVIALPDTTHIKIVNPNAIGAGSSSGGRMVITTVPVISTFTPSYPVWTTAVAYAVNSIITPTVSNGFYYKAIQGGTSGGSQPSFPTAVGATVADGSVIWVNAGALNSAAPPPPGCAHIAVYSGSVWMFNTSPSNTSTGLDGPCSLRMCDINNLQSWNPINQAFLDKDDGTEGMGLAVFTITAQGIPPEGSMVAMKQYAVYQIVGVFGSDNFAIQRAETDMGCMCPRTLQFIPGFGIGRIAHLGFAIFDGVNDRVISPQIQPYLFINDDPDLVDIVPIDQSWQSVAWSAQTANPPMYVTAIPVANLGQGSSNGMLTRILCFDLTLKAWSVVDLPFPVSTMIQVRTVVSQVVTLFGSYLDGTLQRWQAADVEWATSVAGSSSPTQVAWQMRTPAVASKDPDERLFCRRIMVRGQQNNSSLFIRPRVAGISQDTLQVSMPSSSGDFAVECPVLATNDRFDAVISGFGPIVIDSFGFHLEPRPVGLVATGAVV